MDTDEIKTMQACHSFDDYSIGVRDFLCDFNESLIKNFVINTFAARVMER
jgi:hypothetical protein